MDRIEAIQAFVAVVDAGSFVAAADKLQLSKAVVSRQLAMLEDELGTRLLHRTTRRVSLTSDGELFLGRSREFLQQWQEALDEVSHRSVQARGTLRINVPFSYGVMYLAPLWPVFMQRHPDVLLDVTLSDRVTDLVDEGYDLAVRIGKLPSSSLVSRRLAAMRLKLCAAPTYVKSCGKPKEPSDLVSHRILAYSLLSTGDTWTLSLKSDPTRQEAIDVRPVMRSNNGDTCTQAAIAGQGIVLQPDFMVQRHIDRGELLELLPRWQAEEFGVYAVYPSRRHLPAKVRLMIDFLVANLAPQKADKER
ncbi:MAG: LysR family transcriptional regulator [Burkholderiaceae bacterium]|nr:LysR family transcriptional regulator [Burkholderiaceae bacterium]MCD8517201.1 LysR family transcriptional regulator [Burkholderiaceae bacterium]MCD8536469.1 LysR family transcriptional regulator [Burkholderiaceae bacterium]MCD8565252.1 LysR family transcriptional regulator [Burkholderiaceae bacterium]